MTKTDAVFAFSRAFTEATKRGAGYDEALGCALKAEYSSREPVVLRDNLLAGRPGSASLVLLDHGGLYTTELPESLVGTEHEAEVRAALAEWQSRSTGAAFANAIEASFTVEEKATLQEPSLGWGGGWGGHAILNFEYVLNHGIVGLTDYVQRHLAMAEETGAAEAKLGWYRGLLCVCAGIRAFILNHSTKASQLATEATEEADRIHFQIGRASCRERV